MGTMKAKYVEKWKISVLYSGKLELCRTFKRIIKLKIVFLEMTSNFDQRRQFIEFLVSNQHVGN